MICLILTMAVLHPGGAQGHRLDSGAARTEPRQRSVDPGPGASRLPTCVKLIFKEIMIPADANGFLFRLAPFLALIPSLAMWAVIPIPPEHAFANIDAGLLYILALTSMGVYGIILAGWAANSKYAFLGAMRSAAQIVAYEIAMGFAMVGVLMASGSLNIGDIIHAQQRIVRLELDLAVPADAGVLHFGCRRDQPRAVRCRRGRIGNRRRLPCRLFGHGLCAVLHRRIRQHDFDLGADRHFLLRRMAVAVRRLAVRRIRGLPRPSFFWFGLKTLVPDVHLSVAARDLPALSLRSDHAPGLEGADSGHTGLADWSRASWSISRSVRGRGICNAGHSQFPQDLPAVGAAAGSVGDIEGAVRAQGHASTIRRRRRRRATASAACMRCAAIPTARSAASPASCARRCARRSPSPSSRM